MGARGGRASGVARREKASLRQAAQLILSLDSVDPDALNVMEEIGLDDNERTNAAMVTTAMILKARAGDVRAYEALSKNMPELDDAEVPTGDARVLVPPFDLSANIAPTFCTVSRAIETGTAWEILLKGGRGGTKSSYAYQKGLDVFLRRPHAQWVCLRRVGNTLRRSCFANVLWAISKRGMTVGKPGEPTDFARTVSPMEITYNKTGQKVLFYGVDEPEKLKSITFADPASKIEVVLWEEYDQQDSLEAVRNVEQSLMRADYVLELKLWNPDPDAEQWANKDAEREAPGRIVHHSTWRDVPQEWLGGRFVEQAEMLYEINPIAAKNEYDGECTGLTGKVFENVSCMTITDDDVAGLKWIRNGIDWGFQADPFVFLRVAYDRKSKSLYIFGELYNTKTLDEPNISAVKEYLCERSLEGVPLRTEDGAPLFKRHKPENEIRADQSGAKDIATWDHDGVEVIGASKRVPVADGIRWLQKRAHIYIDRDACPLAYQEFSRYRAVEDDEGRFKGYPDKDNHTIDATRYAVYDLIANPDET
ncbi:MAG: phage terminase large subunit [Gordonibacter sp.]|uniref:PBSX family phage terminase large subunit n=1 Tax=Gordonibacter sp. TaxID=1968902 RepID=UPI002FC82D26